MMELLPNIYPVTCHTDHVGPGSTFVAIKGFREDGIGYIKTALEKGAAQIIIDNPSIVDTVNEWCLPYQATVTVVDDARKSLAEQASQSLGHPWKKLTIIGITGTKGKTTTAYLTEHILRHAGLKTALLSTIQNRIGTISQEVTNTTPSSDFLHMFFAECVKQDVTHVVMEVSSHALSLHRVHGIHFAGIGFTNLAPEHMDFHPTMEDYFAVKASLFSQICPHGTIVINTDNDWGYKAYDNAKTEQLNQGAHLISFGMQTQQTYEDQHVPFTITKTSFEGIQLTLNTSSPTSFSCPTIFGTFNCYNLSMASLLCLALGISPTIIAQSLAIFPGVPGRLQNHKLKNGAHAFVDYAHNPSSFHEVLKTLRPYTSNLIVVFGCGGNRDTTKRPVMGSLANQFGDKVIITDDNPRYEDRHSIINEILAGITPENHHKVIIEPDRKKAIQMAVESSGPNSIIAILGKGPENYYLIQGQKLHHNDYEEIIQF